LQYSQLNDKEGQIKEFESQYYIKSTPDNAEDVAEQKIEYTETSNINADRETQAAIAEDKQDTDSRNFTEQPFNRNNCIYEERNSPNSIPDKDISNSEDECLIRIHQTLIQSKHSPYDKDVVNSLQHLDIPNNSIERSNDTVSSTNSGSNYRYTVEDIVKFFASDNGQEGDHSFEESICRPLIGQRRDKPFFYYCKEDTNVEFFHLKSIEDHIRLKDPERHKAKLLKLLQKKESKEKQTK
jgi:hypothetical protein